MDECYHRDYTHGVDPKRLPCKTGVVRSRESTTDNPDEPLDLDRIRRAAKTSGTAILCDALEACRAERDEALAAVADCKAELHRRALDAIAALLDSPEWKAFDSDGYEDDVEDYDIKTGTYCECGAKYDPELPGYECAR
jgi:hypothetical protein